MNLHNMIHNWLLTLTSRLSCYTIICYTIIYYNILYYAQSPY